LGNLQRSPIPLAGFKGPTSKGREGREGEGREGEGRGGKGRDGRGGEGKRTIERSPAPNLPLYTPLTSLYSLAIKYYAYNLRHCGDHKGS